MTWHLEDDVSRQEISRTSRRRYVWRGTGDQRCAGTRVWYVKWATRVQAGDTARIPPERNEDVSALGRYTTELFDKAVSRMSVHSVMLIDQSDISRDPGDVMAHFITSPRALKRVD